MKRIWPVALVLFTIAFVILIQSDPSEKYDQPAANVGVVGGNASTPFVNEPGSSGDSQSQAAIERSAAAPTTNLVESTAGDSASLATFQLTVVDGTTQQPIPFAEVYEIREEDELRFQRIVQRAKSSSWVHADAELLRLHKADKDGVLQLAIPAEDNYKSLLASHEGLFGDSGFRLEAGKQERLELWPDQSWTVLCLNEIGQPLEGFPVALRMWLDNRESPWFPNYSTTNTDGMATLPHIQRTAKYAKDADAFKVVPNIPMQEDVGIEVDIRAAPPMPVTLHLPPMGSLNVSVLAAGGKPLASEFNLRMVIDPAPISGRSVKELKEAFRTMGQSTFHTTGTQGLANFPFMGLGLNLVLQVTPLGKDAFYGTGIGPQRSGETATIEVHQPKRLGFAMRLLDEQKLPLTKATWNMSYRIEKDDWGRSRIASGETDHDGNAFLDLDLVILDFLVDATKSEFEISCNTQNPAQIFHTTGSFLTHRDAADQGLGDLILERQKTIDLHGTAVDFQGNPIEKAGFFVQEKVMDENVENWVSLGAVYTNAKGEFRYFQRLPEGGTRYSISAKGYLGQMKNGLPENGAEFILSRGAHISGTITIQDWMKDTSVYVMSRPSNTPEARWTHAGYLDRKTGAFKLEAMRPATVDLALRTGYVPFPVATMKEVTPWEMEGKTDSRLAPWTPNPVPHLFSFEVLDIAGEIVYGVTACFPDQPFFNNEWPRTLRPGNLIVLPVSAALVKVLAPGYRSITFEAVAGPNTVSMQSGLMTRFHLKNPPPLQLGDRIGYEILPESRSALGTRKVVSSWQELDFICSDPGSYTVKIVMIPKGEEPWLESSTTIVEQTVEVLDQETEQVISLELDAQ